ncbi:hypothetical protein J8C07_14405 [Chloracidobacterium sp. S]|uniref:hypothetical protein n=1 Tax=Chloracidobacterium aggregatum TaxID=2851959 RepID=UPI001B8CE879|nr:hypothetical protein [Chloracidobacterium aggregatum]QUV89018.1 hypothetical protein J8C07_14405 [Chloracidobacterium sp. S]
MYTNVNELLRAMRRSLAAHPAERDTLKAIATIARRDGLEAGIAAYEDWKQSRLAGAPDDAAKPALPAASSPAPAHVSQPDGPTCTAITQDAPCGITGQSTQPGKADARQSGALEPTPKGNDAPDDATRTGGITKQSTLPSEADAGALPAGESSPAAKSRFEPFEPDVEGSIANLVRQASGKASGRASGTSPSTPAHARQTDTQPSGASRQAQTHAEPAVDTSPSDAPQNAPEGTTRQSTQPGEAASQPDDALVRLRAQIDGCLAMETNPALRLFLEQLRRDIHKYPAEFVHQELEAYLQPGTPGDFLDRLAALHMSWALDDVAVDPDGKRLVRGDTGGGRRYSNASKPLSGQRRNLSHAATWRSWRAKPSATRREQAKGWRATLTHVPARRGCGWQPCSSPAAPKPPSSGGCRKRAERQPTPGCLATWTSSNRKRVKACLWPSRSWKPLSRFWR